MTRRKAFTAAPVIRPVPSLNERELRFAPLWRTVALLCDQAEESAAKYPNSLTAKRHGLEFQKALGNLIMLHADFWQTPSAADNAEARREDEQYENNWLANNATINPAS